MNKTELQTQILNNTRVMFRLADAISRLPGSETRGELIYKHEKILQRLADLQANIELTDCYYGFTDKCPGIPCWECRYLRGNNV